MRKTLTAVALVLVLSCPALAGVMHTPPAPEPPPTAQETTAEGEILTPPLVQLALSLFTLF